MSETRRCESCGGPMPEDGPLGGACPRCMLELGIQFAAGSSGDADSTLAHSKLAPSPRSIVPPPTVVGRYRILRLIGEGGMGAVYEAEQDHPRRIVALKIIKPGVASPELLRRFEQESHALGRLQHPGIAQIYEAGTADTGLGAQPYFAMEFIRGKTLSDYAETHHLNTRQRLEMVSKIAEAVQHAHQRGLIHRDLKPANILIDETGQPKILDFGVARSTGSDAQATSETNIGQLVGTLAYMSPEQVLADPLELDTRSDVYALGVILYELLAGKLPHTISKKLHETIQAIREQDPARLSSINRNYRGDIETIVAKALEKDKTRRYGSAAELAADIQRYLKDEPVVARPPSTAYQLQKFGRRNKALVLGLAAVFVVLVGGIVASTLQATRARRAEATALVERDRANDNQRAEAQARSSAESARVRADAETFAAQQALHAAQVNLYFNNIALADREWLASHVANVERLLDEAPTPLRNWEWNYLSRLTHMEDAVIAGHRDAIDALTFLPDGKTLRTIGEDKTFNDWDIRTWEKVATGTLAGDIPALFSKPYMVANGRLVYSQEFSRLGLSYVRPVLRAWDLPTGREKSILLPSEILHHRVLVSPDGARAVSQERTGNPLRLWDVSTGRELGTLGLAELEIAFSPDGNRLAVAKDDSIKILSAATGQEMVTLGNSQGYPDPFLTVLSFSRDGTTVVAGIRGVRAWSVADGKERWSLKDVSVTALAFSPDSHLVAVALADRTILILDSDSGREVNRLVGHSGAIRTLDFTPEGMRLVSAGDDKLLHVWNVKPLTTNLVVDAAQAAPARSIGANPDGHTLLIETRSGLKFWDINTGESEFERPIQLRPTSTGLEYDFDATGARVALLRPIPASTDGGKAANFYLEILDAHSGRQIAEFQSLLKQDPGRPYRPNYFRISPNGNRVALAVSTPKTEQTLPRCRIDVWDVSNRQPTTSFDLDDTAVYDMGFSPNGRLLAIVTRTYAGKSSKETLGLEIYDATTGHPLSKLNVAELAAVDPLFSPDGNRLAAHTSSSIAVLDVRTDANLVTLQQPSGDSIEDKAFSPDGTRFVTVSSDGNVQLWDIGSGKAVISLRSSSGPYAVREVTGLGGLDGPASKVYTISFSPDGRKITLMTVTPDPMGWSARFETWDGTPRQK